MWHLEAIEWLGVVALSVDVMVSETRGTIDLCSVGMQAQICSEWWITGVRARN
jgi:hypothetical protein